MSKLIQDEPLKRHIIHAVAKYEGGSDRKIYSLASTYLQKYRLVFEAKKLKSACAELHGKHAVKSMVELDDKNYNSDV